MGLSISILVSAWHEILKQKLFNLVYSTTTTNTFTTYTSRAGHDLAALRKTASFKKTDDHQLPMSPHHAFDGSSPTNNNTRAGFTKKDRNNKPEDVVVGFDRSLSFKDFLKESFSRGANGLLHKPLPAISLPNEPAIFASPRPPSVVFASPLPVSELDAAAVKLQKVYKSYRTRRNLADCAVVVEELWWKALDFAALKRSSVSFFDGDKHETAVSRWARARTRVAKVGKGLSKDDKAQKLALQHWLEAIDPRHRYGHNLHLYYDIWFQSESFQPFFYWLDVGDGKELNLDSCPRTKLQQQCIKYLGPKEREAYQVVVEDGKLVYKESGSPVNTVEGSKWIFVLSTSRALYIGQKQKGAFQHSSFLAGAATTAAGRLIARQGVLEAIWPYSGHYLPTEENFKEFVSFLAENQVDLSNVKRYTFDEESRSFKVTEDKLEPERRKSSESTIHDMMEKISKEGGNTRKPPAFDFSKRLSCKWATGHGPRIGCVRDYPANLQSRALEQVNLSPRLAPTSAPPYHGPIPSPRPSPKIRLSPRLAYMGLPSPRSQISAAAG